SLPGVRGRLVVWLQGDAGGARAGAGVRRVAVRVQCVRRGVPPRGVPQHQGRALVSGLQGLQVRGAGGAAQQHHRQGTAEAVPGHVLLAGTVGIRPEDIPWIEEDGVAGLPWAPEAEVRILRVPPFAQGIARRAVEEYVLEQTHEEAATVTNKWLDEAIRKLLPTHMQLIMGIGTAEEIALAEVKAQEQLKATRVQGHDSD